MVKKFSPEENENIYSSVKKYKDRYKRMQENGQKLSVYLPNVYSIKSRYKNRSKEDLNKELKLLNRLSKDDAYINKTYESLKGGKINRFEFEYLKINTDPAYKYFEDKFNYLSSRLGDYPSERLRLGVVREKMALLRKDPKDMSTSELKTYRATVNEYLAAPNIRRAGYRGFMAEVEGVMDMLGYSDEDIKKMYRKLRQLNPDQFEQMYRHNDLVQRIFELADSPEYAGGLKLNVDDDKAIDLIGEFLANLDGLIKEYKNW